MIISAEDTRPGHKEAFQFQYQILCHRKWKFTWDLSPAGITSFRTFCTTHYSSKGQCGFLRTRWILKFCSYNTLNYHKTAHWHSVKSYQSRSQPKPWNRNKFKKMLFLFASVVMFPKTQHTHKSSRDPGLFWAMVQILDKAGRFILC